MKDVTIQVREEGEGHPEDIILYAALNVLIRDTALELRARGDLTDHQIIAITVRALQQLAANATTAAEELGIEVEVA